MDDLLAFHDALIAIAGAAATLAGLILAAMTVSISAILKISTMPSRAGSSIGSLVGILVVSIAALIPNQGLVALGVEVLVVATVCLGLQVQTSMRQFQQRPRQLFQHLITKLLLSAIQSFPLVVSGILLVCHTSGGLDWLVIASVLTFAAAIVNAWVMLVEIRR